LRVGSLTVLVFSAMAFWIHCAMMSESTLGEAGPAVRSHLLAISVWVGLFLVTTYVVLPRLFSASASEHATSAAFVRRSLMPPQSR
jgi:hypothetical protein